MFSDFVFIYARRVKNTQSERAPDSKKSIAGTCRGIIPLQVAAILVVYLQTVCQVQTFLFSFVLAAKHVLDFVLVEFLHLVAGRAEILAGVELTGLLVEDLADSGGHSQTAV